MHTKVFSPNFDCLIGNSAGRHGTSPMDGGSRGEDRLAKGRSSLPREPAVSHRASLDVSAPVLKAVTGWVARRRRRMGSRPSQRAGTVHTQVVLVLRWLRHRLDVRTLAADTGLASPPRTAICTRGSTRSP